MGWVDDEGVWRVRGGDPRGCARGQPARPVPPRNGARRANRQAAGSPQGGRHQRHGQAQGSPPADLFSPRRSRGSGSHPLHVLPLLGGSLERAGYPRGADLLRLSPAHLGIDAFPPGRDQEGSAGLDREAAAPVDPGPRAPGVRALPPHAAHQGAGSAIVRHRPRPGRAQAPGLSGVDPEEGLVRHLSRAARGEPRLHPVPLLMGEPMERRRFLKVLGVTGGGAALLSGCGIGPEPTEKLIPYLIPPDDQVPGTPTYYATTCRECPAGCGLHAKVREGRVVKLEGNPESPINHGRLCPRGQAGLQGLYNPDRVAGPLERTGDGQWKPIAWDDAIGRVAAKVKGARGKGIVFVTGHESGAFGELVDEWMRQVGGRHVIYEPFAFEALREGNRLAFGTSAVPWYDFANARYLVSFGADFLDTWVSPVGYQNGFARAHGFQAGRDASMAKFVFVGPRLSLTGMNADEWIAAAPGTEGLLALAMASVIVRERLAPVPSAAARLASLLSRPAPAQVASAGGIEPSVIARPARAVAAAQGRLAVLLVHGATLAHSLPGAFSQAIVKVGFKVGFSPSLDETAAAADLILPDLHPLEQWNDARPRAGLFALLQPVMQPVFPDARHTGDVLLRASGRDQTFQEYLQGRWRELHRRHGGGKSFEQFWGEALQHGGVYGEAPLQPVRLASGVAQLTATPPALAGGPGETVLTVFPSIGLYDGRGANKPWLQELPDPVSKITWHAWVEIHPATATRWGLANGDVLLLKSPYGAVKAPVWITPGVRPDVLAAATGQGHTAYGRYAKDRSGNAFELLSSAPNGYGGRTFSVAVSVVKTGEHRRLATAEGDPRELGAHNVEVLPLGRARQLKSGEHAFEEHEAPAYAERALEDWAAAQQQKASLGNYAGEHPRWGLAIDLATCTGCSACVTACYAENNIATVGEELVVRRRVMSWMRVERYYTGGEHREAGGAG